MFTPTFQLVDVDSSRPNSSPGRLTGTESSASIRPCAGELDPNVEGVDEA
jgi:hypothetical protein